MGARQGHGPDNPLNWATARFGKQRSLTPGVVCYSLLTTVSNAMENSCAPNRRNGESFPQG